jgi:parallel beta-helix repeat protein
VSEYVVDPWPGRGQFTSIQAAIDAAEPGARILIRPGTYAENLRLDKALELIGDGTREEIGVVCTTGNALQATATIARVAGIRFMRAGKEGEEAAVWMTSGRTEFVDCLFTSQARSAVEVSGAGTDPVFRRCTFRDSAQDGLILVEHARGTVEDCEITGNGLSGLAVAKGGDPTVRRSVLRDNKGSGMYIYENGRGTVEDCEITGNGECGIEVAEGGGPTVRGCIISKNAPCGIKCDGESGGTFEGNDLRGNVQGAWEIAAGAESNLKRRNNTE